MVDCSYKADYLKDIVSILSLQHLLPSNQAVWTALTSFCSIELIELDENVLVALGAAFTTLWKYHWRCVIDTEPWISSAALNMVRQDHGLLFSSLFPSASFQVDSLPFLLT